MARSAFSSRFALVLIMTLFALPFLGAGCVMLYFAHRPILEHLRTRTWNETPARVVEMDRVGKSFVARYEYQVAGQQRRGTWALKLTKGSVGFLDKDQFDAVKQAFKTRQPIHCFVNPQDDSESVLFRTPHWRPLAGLSFIAALFGGVGAGMLALVLAGARSEPVQIAGAPEQEPWLTRSDWRSGHIQPQVGSRTAAIGFGAFALWWWLSTAAALLYLPYFLFTVPSRWVWLVLIIPVVGTALAAVAVYHLQRQRKFGAPHFELSGPTGVVGGQLAGIIHIPAIIPQDTTCLDGIRLRLACLGEKRRRDDIYLETLWEEEQLVTKPIVDVENGRTAVPVLFAIPFDALESATSNSERDIRWELTASTDSPGVDFKSTFVVPVFKTPESSPDFRVDQRLAREIAPPPDRSRLFRASRIYVEPVPSGDVRLTVPMARNWPSALLVTMAVAVMSTVIWFAFHAQAWLVAGVFALLTPVFAWLVLDMWFYKSTVDASPTGLAVRGGLFGLGRTRRVTPKEFQKFTSKDYMSSGRSVWCTISVKPRNRPRVTIAKGIRGKLLERAIIDELESALGRNER